MAVMHQKNDNDMELDSRIIDAAYSHHVHTRSSCFGITSSKTMKRLRDYECRYRLPAKKRCKTIIQDASNAAIKRFSWDGSCTKWKIKEICIERNEYNAFQNVCCPAISHSKLTCNTNVTAVLPGPVAEYTFKYQIKNTQKQDTEGFEQVSEATRIALTTTRKHESNSSESMRKVLAASFAHQSTM